LKFHGSKKFEVRSCGTGKGAPLNKLIAKRMRTILSEMGYNPEGFRSRGVNAEDIAWADKIIVMANAHLKYFSEYHPEVIDKIEMWPVPDPHFAQGTELHLQVARDIEQRVLLNFCDSIDSV
jgi:protein-tyrosine-phosphatase